MSTTTDPPETIRFDALRTRAQEVRRADLDPGDLVVFVALGSSYPPDMGVPVYVYDGSEFRAVHDGSEGFDDPNVFKMWRLR